MKKILLIPISLVILSIIEQVALAKNPTCEEQYETWLMMEACDTICDFSPNIKDFILKYLQNSRYANNEYCNSRLSDEKMEEIGFKVLPVIRDGYLDLKNNFGQQGHQAFCDSMKKLILDIKSKN